MTLCIQSKPTELAEKMLALMEGSIDGELDATQAGREMAEITKQARSDGMTEAFFEALEAQVKKRIPEIRAEREAAETATAQTR